MFLINLEESGSVIYRTKGENNGRVRSESDFTIRWLNPRPVMLGTTTGGFRGIIVSRNKVSFEEYKKASREAKLNGGACKDYNLEN